MCDLFTALIYRQRCNPYPCLNAYKACVSELSKSLSLSVIRAKITNNETNSRFLSRRLTHGRNAVGLHLVTEGGAVPGDRFEAVLNCFFGGGLEGKLREATEEDHSVSSLMLEHTRARSHPLPLM